MAVRFESPAALALLLLVPGLIWLARRKLLAFGPRRRAFAFATRAALLACLVVALAEPSVGRPDQRLSLILAIDGSASIQAPRQLAQRQWADEAARLAGPDDRVTQLQFGRWAAPAGGQGSDGPPGDATNLADALTLGGALLPTDGRRRIVLLTDGQQNLGRAQDVAADLAGRGIEVSYLQPEPALVVPDVVLRSLAAPEYVREGETLQAEAEVLSTHPTGATARLLIDGRPASERQVALEAGAQRVPLVARGVRAGFHTVRAEIVAPDDAQSANNSAEATTIVKESGRVLLLEGHPGEAAAVDGVLRASGLRTEVRAVGTIPPNTGPLVEFDTLVLVNVPNTALTLDQQATVVSFVRDLGRGLLVIGGPTSYSLGGYQDTPLGEALPVDPAPPARRELGSVALVLVIDKSGSMELNRRDASKMAMARTAAGLAIDALKANDQVGVIAFDTRFNWVVPMVRLRGAADVNAVKGQVATIQADGGTSIFPALEAAYQAASAAQARIKHIVLLTDGQSTDGDYAGLIARMKPANITLTSIAIGGDADTGLLTRLAQLGDGRYYFTERSEEIPRLVTRETTIVSRNALVEGMVRPRPVEPSPLLADLAGQPIPPLAGYVGTGTRQGATTILTTDQGDPLLASWQYGLGRVVAWTSDAQPTWAGAWLESPEARRVWSQAARWAMPPPVDPGFQVSSEVKRERVAVRVQATDPDGRFSDGRTMQAVVTTPGRRALQLPLRQTGPGSYETLFEVGEPGAYGFDVAELRNGAPARSESGGFVVRSDEELRTLGGNRPLLEQLAQATGGRELTEPGEAYWAGNRPAGQRWLPAWPWLLGLAVLLLPIDVAARRLSLYRRR